MAERDFQTELLRGIESVGGHGYKIPDMPHHLAKQSRFTPKKPYDCYWAYSGAWHVMELKQVRQGLSFALSSLPPHQEEALLEVEDQGHPGWLVVNFRVRLSKRQRQLRGMDVMDRAFGVRIHQVVHARTLEARTGLPLDWWEEHGVELARFYRQQSKARAVAWDPRPLHALVSAERRAA